MLLMHFCSSLTESTFAPIGLASRDFPAFQTRVNSIQRASFQLSIKKSQNKAALKIKSSSQIIIIFLLTREKEEKVNHFTPNTNLLAASLLYLTTSA